MLKQAIAEAEEVARILDDDFWAVRSLLDGKTKQLINNQVGVKSVRFANTEQAEKIKELTMEKIEPDKEMKKVTLDLDKYKVSYAIMQINSKKSLEEAESLRKQVKAAKATVIAVTELDWKRKKEKYETYRDKSKEHLKKLKTDYDEIANKKNTLVGVCVDIYQGLKAQIAAYNKKIEDKRIEEERKVEEDQKIEDERRAEQIREDEEKAALEAKKKLEEEKAIQKPPIDTTAKEVTASKDGMKVISETGITVSTSCFMHGDFEGEDCPKCLIEMNPEGNPPQPPLESTETGTTQPPQKEEEEREQRVRDGVDLVVNIDPRIIEVDIKALAFAVFQGMAPEELLLPNAEKILEILRGGGTVPGCKFKES